MDGAKSQMFSYLNKTEERSVGFPLARRTRNSRFHIALVFSKEFRPFLAAVTQQLITACCYIFSPLPRLFSFEFSSPIFRDRNERDLVPYAAVSSTFHVIFSRFVTSFLAKNGVKKKNGHSV